MAVRRWIDRISASDPGRMRLQKALRVTFAVACSVLSMLFIVNTFAKGEITAAILSGIISLMSITAVNDDTMAEQKVTTCLLPLSGGISVTVGTWTSTFNHVIDIVLLIVIFSAFYLQRYRSRYFSLCMVSFFSLYISVLLHVKFDQLLLFLIGIIIGVASAYLSHFILFKERSDRTLKRSMASFHIQVNLTFDIMIDMIQDLKINWLRLNRLNRHITKLNAYTRMLSGELHSTEPSRIWPGIRSQHLRVYIFNAEMLIETLFSALKRLKLLHAFENDVIRKSLLNVVRSLRYSDVQEDDYDHSHLKEAENAVRELRAYLDQFHHKNDENQDWLYLIRRVESIASHLIEGANRMRQIRIENINKEKLKSFLNIENSESDELESSNNENEKGMRVSTKKAVQAAIACELATIFGYLLSPAHQFWALLSAFVVLLGTESVGRTFVKAFHRFIGTLIGAVCGFFFAHLVDGRTDLELLLLFICIFMAFYLLDISYALMTFWMTMVLAIMYNLLLGGVNEQLLTARVIDTLVGVGIGLLVSVLVLPIKTRDKVSDRTVDFLNGLKLYLNGFINKLIDSDQSAYLADMALELDEKLQQIRDEAKPLHNTPGALGRSGIERRLTVLTALNYYAKHLTASTNTEGKIRINPFLQRTLIQVNQRLQDNLDTLNKLMIGKTFKARVWKLEKEREQIERFPEQSFRGNSNQDQLVYDLYYIWRINSSIVSLAKDFGAEVITTIPSSCDRSPER
ncbi:FUSC family protein [Scopulibacillus cellulosilyticus]|uniref:FUSC family protein n=1 Tax=Scopulibacillus cellulosilyticus TaxID=2665665 RepID=A0ABW2PX12_9BACL